MQHSIAQPALAMMALTFFVWLLMYIQRLRFMLSHQIAPAQVSTPERMNAAIPEYLNHPSNNLKNLFELPVIFYAVCAISLALQQTDNTIVALAWAYVIFRALHSAIHCTVNHVPSRFAAYGISSMVLWFMVGRLAASIVTF